MSRAAAAAIAAIGVAFAALFAAPVLIPSDFVKTRIAALVRRETGRDLRIAGAVEYSLLPRPRLIAHDVVLASPPGDFTTDFMTVPTVEISLKPLALLRGAIEADRVGLSRPQFSFEIDRLGRRNWLFGGSRSTGSGTDPAGNTAPPIAFDLLTVADGDARYVDSLGGASPALSGIDLTAKLPRPEGPLDAAGTARYNGDGFRFALSLATPQALFSGTASDTGLDIEGPRGSLAFHGAAGGGTSIATGRIEIGASSAGDFLAWVRPTPGMRLEGPLSIAGRIEARGGQLDLSDARISLGANAAEAAIVIEHLGGTLSVAGHLEIDRLDLDPFIKPAVEVPPASEAPADTPAPSERLPAAGQPSTAGWSRAAIDLAPLKLANAALNVTVNSIRLRRLVAGKGQLVVRLKNGRLDLDITSIAIYGGTGTGKIVVDGGGSVPAFGARFYVAGIRIGRAPLGVAGFSELSGAGDLSLDLIGRGRNIREIVESLNGIGGLKLTDGTIGSAGLAPLLRDTLGPAVDARPVPHEIRYRALSGTATIARGVLRNSDLKLSSQQLSATAAGTLDLASRRIDYLWQPDIPGVGTARIAVTGAWDAPAYTAQSVTVARPTNPPKRQLR